MSCDLYIMVCRRKSLIDKFEVCKIGEEVILPIYAGASIRDFMQELADEYGIMYKKEYLINPPDLNRKGFNEPYEIIPYFINAKYIDQQFEQLANEQLDKSDEYYADLSEERLIKLRFLGQLLGMIDCFDQSCDNSERYLLYYYE